MEEVEDIREVPSELDIIVAHLQETVENLQIPKLPQPWLPPLSSWVSLFDLYEEVPQWKEEKGPLQAVIGLVDLPNQQAQEVLLHDFDSKGHLALFSGPGMGKTTFLQTVVMDLARRFSPQQVHFYLLDFGTNGLLSLNGLPHTADLIYADDEQRIPKLVGRIMEEMKKRKALLARHMVPTIQAYEKTSGQSLPTLVFVVDSFEGLRGSRFEEALEKLLTTISRDGANLGLYLLMTSSRLGTMRPGLHSNLSTKLTLKHTDDSESRVLVGRFYGVMEDVPGRGLIKLEEPQVFQVALPVEAEDELEIFEKVTNEVKRMNQAWSGPRPERLPIVPDVLTIESFNAMAETQKLVETDHLPIGIDFEEVTVKSLPLAQWGHLLVLSDKETAKEAVLSHLMKQLAYQFEPPQLALFDLQSSYQDAALAFESYAHEESDYGLLVSQLKEEVLEARRGRHRLNRFLIITDLGQFVSKSAISDQDFALLFEEGKRVGLHIIYVTNKTYMNSFNGIQKYLKAQVDTALIAMKMMDQAIFTKSFSHREEPLALDEVYLHRRDRQEKIKITKVNNFE